MPEVEVRRARVWWFVAAIPLVMWLTHYLAVIPHEFSHSITAWILGIKPEPGNISWGGSSLWNVTLLDNIDENVDYSAALVAGQHWQVAVVAVAGPGLGNAVPYLISRMLIKRSFFATRPIASFVLFWYLFFGMANLWDYVPTRTFAGDGDVTHFVEGSGMSRWWIYAVVGYGVLWAIVDFYRVVMPYELGVLGFERVAAARACFLVAATLVLFGYYAIPPLGEPDPVSLFMGRTSLLMIPGVLIACWRRNVLADLPGPRLLEPAALPGQRSLATMTVGAER